MKVTGSGLRETQEHMRALGARLRNLQPVLEVVAQDTKTLIDDSFHTSTSPSGAPWRPLSDATMSINPRRKGGKPLLDTGRLRNSVTTTTSAKRFTFGSNTVYAGTHQFGRSGNLFGSSRKVLIPARPFMPIEQSGGRFALMSGGRAGLHWRDVRAAVAHYIRTGQIR